MTIPPRAPIRIQAGQLVRLKDVGRDEHWLQDWLSEDLSRLGLGSLRLIEQEQPQAGGGNLDILASTGDIYYSVEVQLGEVDASHSFRVFDYWARNKRRFPDKTNVAVLVAESTIGRFRPALEELAVYVPLLVVELRSWLGASEVVIVPELVVANGSVDVSGTPLAITASEARTAEDWQASITDQAWVFHEVFAKWAAENLGPIKIDYSPKSYIGIRVGRRVWAPLWPRQDGAFVYLPDPDHSKKDESPAFLHFRELLSGRNLDLSWTNNYNAGANPVAVRLQVSDLEVPEVQEFLRATYAAVKPGAENWSDRHAASEAETGEPSPTSAPAFEEPVRVEA